MHLHVGEDDRLLCGVDHLDSFSERFAQRPLIAFLMKLSRLVVRNAWHRSKVARQLDVHRPFIAQRGVQHPVDLLKRSLRIAQDRGGDSELLEDLLLRVELADFVVQQRILFALLHSRRAADDDDR